jgi:hypothetical protein
MRTVSGGLLVAVGLLLFYLIVTGRLKAALMAYHTAVGSGAGASTTSGSSGPLGFIPSGFGGTPATAGATPSGQPGGFQLPPLPTLPTLTVNAG